MKRFSEFLESWNVSVSGVKGDEGYSYDKWGRKGQVDAWKKHVQGIHKGVKFTHADDKTHAHVGDREVGSYSHFNHSSKTRDA